MLQHVQDTFLKFLAANLPSISIHPVREDSSDPASDMMAIDSLNVEFTDMLGLGGDNAAIVALDIVNKDGRVATAQLTAVLDILTASYMIPLYDYTNPASPISLNTNIFWDRERIRFAKVKTAQYAHYSCVLTLRFA